MLAALVTLGADPAFGADDGRMRFDGAAYPKPRADEAEAFFAGGYIPQLKIALSQQAFESLQRDARSYVRGTVTEGETVYKDVGIHVKGAAGSFRAITDRPALTLNFDKYNRNQRFHGLDKLHLNNSVQDGTYCQEFLGGMISRAAGVPAAQVSHARVELNGRALGLYVLIEGLDAAFLRRHFTNWYGTMYDGQFTDIDGNLKKTSNDKREPGSDLKALAAAANDPDPVKCRERVAAVLDVDRFLSFMAVEGMISHWDGYCGNRNNYRIYHDPTTDKLVFITHGMDQIFGDPNFNLFMGAGLLGRVLTERPEDKRRYLERVQQLRRIAYDETLLTQTAQQIAARLKPVLEQISQQEAKDHAGRIADLCNRIINRGRGIDKQVTTELGIPPKPVTLEQPANWQTRVAEGNAALDEFKEGDRPRLRIRANNQWVLASWRTRVVLPQGRYVFEGRVRTVDVPVSTDVNLGAALRISGGDRRFHLTGTTDWQKFEYQIEVNEASADVELVCEFRAERGEVWFETDSLRIVRK